MSNNLDLAQVTANQNQKEVTINQQAAQLDAALTDVLNIPIDDGNAETLSNTQFRRHFLFHVTEDSPPPDNDITLTVPAVSRGVFAVLNLTNEDVAVTISGQSLPAPVIEPGSDNPTLLTSDGVNVRLASSGGVGGAGTTKLNFSSSGHAVAADSTQGFDLTTFANRAISRRIRVTETGGTATEPYNLRFYSKDTKQPEDLLYSVEDINPTLDSRVFQDHLPVMFEDEDLTEELHMAIDNQDAAEGMEFTVSIIGEKFA